MLLRKYQQSLLFYDKHDYRKRDKKDAGARIPTPLLSEKSKRRRQAEKERWIGGGGGSHSCGGAHDVRDRCFRHHICELKPALPRFGVIVVRD